MATFRPSMAPPAPTPVRVILNPAAAGGAALGSVEAIGAALRSFDVRHDILLTRAPGHGTELARAAFADGTQIIAVAGGDGTLAEVVAAYVDERGQVVTGAGPLPELALLPIGGPGDFARTLGLQGSLAEAAARLKHGTARAIDLGIVEARVSPDASTPARRAFLSGASVGLLGEALARLDVWASAGTDARRYGTRFLGTRGKLLLGAARAVVDQRTVLVRVTVDGTPVFDGAAVAVVVANGRYVGGGLMIAPHADPGDGRLEVVVVGDLPAAKIARLVPKLLRGSHLTEEGVTIAAGKHVVVEPLRPWARVLVEADGAQVGTLPLEARLLPGALTFRV
jgi:YegS/Rv2252/BmrU family lipid kinase